MTLQFEQHSQRQSRPIDHSGVIKQHTVLGGKRKWQSGICRSWPVFHDCAGANIKGLQFTLRHIGRFTRRTKNIRQKR